MLNDKMLYKMLIEEKLTTCLKQIKNNNIYVSNEQNDYPKNSIHILYTDWINITHNQPKYIDTIHFDNCVNITKIEELFSFFQSIYHQLNDHSKLMITFKDYDFLSNLINQLDQDDVIHYIQRYLYYSNECIQKLYFKKSWGEKARFVIYDTLKNANEQFYSSLILQSLLKQIGFENIKIGQVHDMPYVKKKGHWYEQLEFKTIVAHKNPIDVTRKIYFIAQTKEMSQKIGLTNKSVYELFKKVNLSCHFIDLDDNIDYGEFYECHIYDLLTDIKSYQLTYTVREFLNRFNLTEDMYTIETYDTYILLRLKNNTICRLVLNDNKYIQYAEFYVNQLMMNRLTFTYTLVTEERFFYENNELISVEKLFFNENGSVAFSYEKIKDNYTFYVQQKIITSKESFYQYVLHLKLSKKDKVITNNEQIKQLLNHKIDQTISYDEINKIIMPVIEKMVNSMDNSQNLFLLKQALYQI